MKKIIRTWSVLIAVFVLIFSAKAQNDIDLTGYTLVFSDEFDTLSTSSSTPKGAAKWYTGYPPNGSAGVYDLAKDDPTSLSVSNGILINKLKLTTVVGTTGSFCGGPVGMKNSSGTAMVSVGTTGSQVKNHSSWQWYGWVGMRFTVGSSPVTISQLGRYAISTNTQKHQVRIFNATTGADVAKAEVNCAGQNGFVYANIIGGNVTLAANTSYFLLTDNYTEVEDDFFYNTNTSVTATGGITVNESRWGTWRAGAMYSVDQNAAGFSQKYGYFSMRAKMPSSGVGSWPSFWLKTLNDISHVGNVAEIDIFEWYGNNFSDNPQKALMQQASHNWNEGGGASYTDPRLYSPYTPMPGGAFPWAGYHIYGFKADPVHCTWYIDGVQTNQIATPSNYLIDPMWILMEYNLGGNWPVTGVVANSQMEVDWVRVYSLPEESGALVSESIGNPALVGTASESNGVFTVQAGGTDIWGNNDQFHFLHQSMTGNGEIVARVNSLVNTDANAKAGLMMRATTAANAAHAFINVTPTNGRRYQTRTSSGGYASSVGSTSGAAPTWLKLVRSENNFTSYVSSDGTTWTQLGATQTISMPDTIKVGLAVTSHNAGALTTSVFDNVTFPGDTGGGAEFNAFSRIQAESYSSQNGVAIYSGGSGQKVGSIENGTWIKFNAVDFDSGASSVLARLASNTSGGTVQFRLNSTTGTLIGSAPVTGTGGWNNFVDVQVPVTGASGVQDLYLVFTGGSGSLMDVDYFEFAPPTGPTLTSEDVGNPALAGAVSENNGVITIQAGGTDIWSNSDQFHFLHQSMTGDGELVVRVNSLGNTDPNAKAGLMMRASTAANAAHAFVNVTPTNGRRYQTRTTNGGYASSVGNSAGAAPTWLRLVRSGDNFTSYVSSNGTSWTQMGSAQTITMPDTIKVGLAVTSHNAAALTTAVFSELQTP